MKKVKTFIALAAVVVAVAACAVCLTACGSNYAAQYDKLTSRCEKIETQVKDGSMSKDNAVKELTEISTDAAKIAEKISKDQDKIPENEQKKITEAVLKFSAAYRAAYAAAMGGSLGDLGSIFG